MEIKYLGHASFLMKTKQGNIVCDPFPSKDAKIGLKFPKNIEANIVTISHDHFDHNAVSEVMGNPYVVKEPGEFEINGIRIFGIQSYHDEVNGEKRGMNTIFIFEVEGLSICHLGDLGHKLNESQAKELDEVDVLMIPVGGKVTLNMKEVMDVINQIEPRIVIPMHYETDASNLDVNDLGNFLKEFGQEKIIEQDKLQISSKENLPEEMQIVVLTKKE